MTGDTAQPARLHIVTPDPQTVPAPVAGTTACTGDYVCDCETCDLERARRVARGVRPRRPLTMRKAA